MPFFVLEQARTLHAQHASAETYTFTQHRSLDCPCFLYVQIKNFIAFEDLIVIIRLWRGCSHVLVALAPVRIQKRK